MRDEETGFRPAGWWARGGTGQSTVEYALVLFAFLAMVLVLGQVLDWAAGGRLLSLVAESSSHTGEGGVAGLLRDVLLY